MQESRLPSLPTSLSLARNLDWHVAEVSLMGHSYRRPRDTGRQQKEERMHDSRPWWKLWIISRELKCIFKHFNVTGMHNPPPHLFFFGNVYSCIEDTNLPCAIYPTFSCLEVVSIEMSASSLRSYIIPIFHFHLRLQGCRLAYELSKKL